VSSHQAILALCLPLKRLEIFLLIRVFSPQLSHFLFHLIYLYIMLHLKPLNLPLEYLYLLILVVDSQIDPLIRVYLDHLNPLLGLSQLISQLSQLMLTLIIFESNSFLCLCIVSHFQSFILTLKVR
jgi:hypothetical protein